MKRQRVKVPPLGPLLGKQNIQLQEVYSFLLHELVYMEVGEPR